MKRVILSLVLALSFANFSLPTAKADTTIFSATSAEDRRQPADMNYRFEPISINVSVMESNKAEIIIKANFASAVSANTFLNYTSSQPLLRIKILNNLTTFKGDAGYIWLDAPNNQPYQGSTKIDALSSIYSDPNLGPSGGRKSLSNCKPKTWMDSGSSSSWVAFSIDRNCANINDLFWVVGYMDSDIWASTFIYDSKFFPVEPIFINMTTVPRPPKMKDQIVGFSSIIQTQNLDNPVVNTSVFSSQGLPVSVVSTTPSVCSVTKNTNLQIQLLSVGNCTLEAFAEGNATVNPAPRVQQTFKVNPKVMVTQEIYWDEPFDVQVGDEDFDLYIYSSSKLPVTVTSQSPSVCQFRDPYGNPSMVTIVGSGYCQISVSQAGNDKYYSKSGSASFFVAKAPVVKPSTTPKARPSKTPNPQPSKKVFGKTTTTEKQDDFDDSEGTATANKKAVKKTTITCYKGVLTKRETGTPPKCPSGWKKK